jgi:hypothetical protein
VSGTRFTHPCEDKRGVTWKTKQPLRSREPRLTALRTGRTYRATPHDSAKIGYKIRRPFVVSRAGTGWQGERFPLGVNAGCRENCG